MKRFFILFLVFMLIPAMAFCSKTKVLEQDTELHPQGWISGLIKFKQGTTVELNDNGEVISGVLKYNKYLRSLGCGISAKEGNLVAYPIIGSAAFPPGSVGFYSTGPYYVYGNIFNFKGSDSVTTFDERGYVISGTLADDTRIYLLPFAEPEVSFKGSTQVTFDKKGYLTSGTLKDDAFLHPVGWKNYLPLDNTAGFLKFKAGTQVTFGPDAQVLKGTIATDLAVNGITYPEGTTLQFSESALPQKN